MGNNSTKEARSQHYATQAQAQQASATVPPASALRPGASQHRRPSPSDTSRAARSRHPGRHELSIFGLGSHNDADPAAPEARRETRAERDARRLEREREQRKKDRERSIQEENVDGGYLVTLGTYTGTEDFSKPVVRQLMIERRLAPFWKGLNDHDESWSEAKFIATVRGISESAAEDVLKEYRAKSKPTDSSPRGSDTNLTHLTVPISSRSPSVNSDVSARSPSQAALSLPSPPSPFGSPPSQSSSPFFRGRAKTLAALTTSSRNSSQVDMMPQEIQLPREPYVHGHPLEVFLYKDATECPICFLSYPPYLNKTRCCDQPICSECFVQIKRPDPHPPEHADPTDPHAPPPEPPSGAEDFMLVSEPATCPFCKQPEFGITYDAPPFRRGLIYAASVNGHPLATVTSAMSSSSSLNSQNLAPPAATNRRRTTSLGANSPSVITTDKIRPDWAKKLSDARAHALRRAAAATALHNAAYVLGGAGEVGGRFTLGRRRRTLFGGESADSPALGQVGALLAAAERYGAAAPGPGSSARAAAAAAAAAGNSGGAEGGGDLFPGRHSSRRSRMEDLEEIMMMEAIRQSLAAEEERKRREEKVAAKEAKREEKRGEKARVKEAKRARREGSAGEGASVGAGGSSVESVNLGGSGEGGAPVEGDGGLGVPSVVTPGLSAGASASSSETPTPGTEPLFNFGSLAAVVGAEGVSVEGKGMGEGEGAGAAEAAK
ncbi:hypothetical protein EJ06DRAFT_560080 [Trichodelitschia bisporula]|uniref:Protein sip5 n=1 Tax=Trichodelitschia bisporula TaxID=703511 RepID=A0A6G1HJF4_9PEZI|nr:hypothetical protein EJ06DRAFT_560080 [Trichodelitschia bisporula]